MRFHKEKRQCGSGTGGKPGMSRLQASGAAFMPVAGPIGIPQLCQSLNNGGQIGQQALYGIGCLVGIGDIVRCELEFRPCLLAQPHQIPIFIKRLACVGQDGFTNGFDQFLGRSDREPGIGIDRIFDALQLAQEVVKIG